MQLPTYVNTRLANKPVGRYTVEQRNLRVSFLNHFLLDTTKAFFLTTATSTVGNLYQRCGAFDVGCVMHESWNWTSVATLTAGITLFSATYLKWKIQNSLFSKPSQDSTSSVSSEIETVILEIIKLKKWTETQQNVNDFIDFAFIQYENQYRDSSKRLDIKSFEVVLKSWLPQ